MFIDIDLGTVIDAEWDGALGVFFCTFILGRRSSHNTENINMDERTLNTLYLLLPFHLPGYLYIHTHTHTHPPSSSITFLQIPIPTLIHYPQIMIVPVLSYLS